MSSQKTDDASATPKTPSTEELPSGELDKVVGGLKKNFSVGKTKPGLTADPCEGGE